MVFAGVAAPRDVLDVLTWSPRGAMSVSDGFPGVVVYQSVFIMFN